MSELRKKLQHLLNDYSLHDVVTTLADVSNDIAAEWNDGLGYDDRLHGSRWSRNANRIRTCAQTLEQ